jgi:hypothetical protein
MKITDDKTYLLRHEVERTNVIVNVETDEAS